MVYQKQADVIINILILQLQHFWLSLLLKNKLMPNRLLIN